MCKTFQFLIASVVAFFSSLAAAADCTEADFSAELIWPSDQAVPVENIPVEHWFISGTDWIVAPNGCMAAVVAGELVAARIAFERYFQQAETSGVVIDLRYAGHSAALSAAGADWILPWQFSVSAVSDEATDDPMRAMIEDQIRSQVESQLSQGGQTPDPAKVEEFVALALSQFDASNAGDDSAASETKITAKRPDAIRHEVAHMLFINELWPSTEAGQYGGDAPDWLDEAAAVLAESEAMTADRRTGFAEAVADGTLMTLQEYLAMPHPAFAGGAFQDLIEQARAQAGDSGVVFMAKTDLPDADLDQAGLYYLLTRGWIDFLHETSQNPRIFANLTRALKAGDSLQDWLSIKGDIHNLPDQVDQLEAAFESWSNALAAKG